MKKFTLFISSFLLPHFASCKLFIPRKKCDNC